LFQSKIVLPLTYRNEAVQKRKIMKAVATNNEQLQNIAETSIFPLFATRIGAEIHITNSERKNNNLAKKHPQAVTGALTATNWIWYSF